MGWHTPWTLILVCSTVSPGCGVNSNILSGLQHRNYIYTGTHDHPSSKSYESIVMHLYKFPPTQCIWTFRHQKLLQKYGYCEPKLPTSFCRIRCTSVIARQCESPYANKTQPWLIRCYNGLIQSQIHIFHTNAQRMNLLPHAVHIHWHMLL